MQKAFGKCSLDFMKKGSRYPPVAPNGYCRLTCGTCNCNTAMTTNPTPSRTQKPTIPTQQRSPTSPVTPARSSPATSRSPGQAAATSTRGPPAPLSAAYLAKCQCTDAPPPDASSCADVVSDIAFVLSVRCQTACVLHACMTTELQHALPCTQCFARNYQGLMMLLPSFKASQKLPEGLMHLALLQSCSLRMTQ